MRLADTIELIDNAYHVQIGLAEERGLTPVEQEAFANFGDAVVDVGGEFSTEGLTFTLPTRDVFFPSGFPVKQIFSLDDFNDANARAVLWRDTIKTRIIAQRDAWLAKSVGNVDENITTV